MKETRKLMIASVLVVAAIAVSFIWFRAERNRQLEISQSQAVQTDLNFDAADLERKSSGEVPVQLYFFDLQAAQPDTDMLRREERKLFQLDDPQLMARQVVSELLKGSRKEIEAVAELPEDAPRPSRTFPVASRLRQLYLLEDGTAVVDLNQATAAGLSGGIMAETAVIRAITRSLRENVKAVKRVRFLIEGKARPTLAGHVSIEQTFE